MIDMQPRDQEQSTKKNNKCLSHFQDSNKREQDLLIWLIMLPRTRELFLYFLILLKYLEILCPREYIIEHLTIILG